MPIACEASIRLALGNIVHFGDTDVFPFPLERTWFDSDEESVVRLLQELDDTFEAFLGAYPVTFVKSLTGVGYHGFRAATQIDPIWDVYLLALVIEIAPDLEAARVPILNEIVFSYRYAPDNEAGSLFNRDIGWRAFQEVALTRAESAKFVLAADISDFYSRVYHHRLENALQLASTKKEVVRRILIILTKLSAGVSYGLPVGGNAARLLAELLLNRVDRLLLTEEVSFCRFVDDYAIFAQSREDAQRALVALSGFLLQNEGLSLSRAKARFMSAAEFRRSSPVADHERSDAREESEARKFLKIKWSYDPYSATADEDYEDLIDEIKKFDILSMLAREFRKTRVDEALVRQLVKSIRFLSPVARDQAVRSLIDNLEALYPVFPTVAIVLRSLLSDLAPDTQSHVFETLRKLISDGSHIVMVPANAVFVSRLLAYDKGEETDVVLNRLYRSPAADEMLRRDIIYAMTRRGAAHWLSHQLKSHGQRTSGELRALIAGSYTLGDEGKYWRRGRDGELSTVDRAFMTWAGAMNNGAVWEIPV